MQEVERSAPTVEEALEAALAELGVSEQEADVEIVQEPRSGFLGIAGQEAVVRVRVRGGPPSEDEEALDEQAEIAADFLEGLLDAVGIVAEVDVNDVDGVTYVEIWADDDPDALGLLIGKRGNTLESIQELVRIVVHRVTGERCSVLVDVEDYRKRRRAQVLQRARDAAERVKKSGRQEALEPMSAYERKLVHDAVAEIGGLTTESEGEDPERRVVIQRGG
ncbi:MAG TPA: RNA-binding cell elongation regulator Jag/EloR [Thermoanaerobaculia bacterium]|jgi:spoIIIJ-associated protein|nr:RNA-binding cell elongation regulator Jag/EloR [Thermoanaerobaculia bacterium]